MEEFNYTPELYTLLDEEGVQHTFELLDVMELDDNKYYAMVPYFENPDDLIADDGELVILKSDFVDGEEMLASVDDDDEFEKVGKLFLARLEEMFEGEDEDGCGCGCHHGDGECHCHDENFEADPLFKDQPEPGAVWLYDAEVHVELVPDTTLNVPFVVSVNNTSPLLFL